MNQVSKITLGVAFGIILACFIFCAGCNLILGASAAGVEKATQKAKAAQQKRIKETEEKIASMYRDGFQKITESSFVLGAKLYVQNAYNKEPEHYATCISSINWIGTEKMVMLEMIDGKKENLKLADLLRDDRLLQKSP